MKFKVGDRVKLKVDKSYEDGTEIPAGHKGTVEKAYPLSISYLVGFDGISKSRRVPQGDLEKA